MKVLFFLLDGETNASSQHRVLQYFPYLRRHGIEPREEAGQVGIGATRKNGLLELRVSDDGAGLPADATGGTREGIGLSNTRSRLQHLYGADFSFELSQRVEGGLEARITIPFRKKDQAA